MRVSRFLLLHCSTALLLILALAAVLALGGTSPPLAETKEEDMRIPKKAQLIDVSNHQGSVNWEKVRGAGIWGAYLKLSEGRDYKDSWTTSKRLKQMESAGLRWGFYHFLRPKRRDAALEARFFIKEAEKLGGWGDFLPVADIEVTTLGPKKTALYLKRFLAVLRKEGGVSRILVYSSPGWWRSHVALLPSLQEELQVAEAWIAHWNRPVPEKIEGIKGWILHQYTDRGRVPGVKGPVDKNRSRSPASLLLSGNS